MAVDVSGSHNPGTAILVAFDPAPAWVLVLHGPTCSRGGRTRRSMVAESRSVNGRQIVGIGGGGASDIQTRALLAHIVGLTGVEQPNVLFVPTATGDASEGIVRFYELYRGLGRLSHLRFFPWPPADAAEIVLAADAVCVGGGNTANMLAIWRVHGFERILREAWERGVLLFGASAGMICWFEAGVTDSFGPELAGMRDGLGFLPGSACPHYDGELRRRPRYRELVDGGFPAGIAADDGVALHYRGTELHEVLTCRPEAAAYRVGTDGETPLPAHLVGG